MQFDKIMSKPSLPFIHLLMVVCAILVSTSFIVVEAIAKGLDPAILTLVRFALAALLLYPYVKVRHGVLVERSLILRCCLISAFLVVFFWCMFLSLRYTSALNTSVIFTLVPSISGIYAIFLVGERLSRGQLLALFFGMFGAVWVLFRGDLTLLMAMNWNKGDVIFFGGCCAMGFYTPLVRLLHRGESMLVMTFWILVTGSVWLFLLAGYRLFWVDWSHVPFHVWAGIVYLALFTTVTTFFLTQFAIPFIGPTRVMAYSYLYPSLVIVLNFFLGRDWPGVQTLPGVIIVLLAMFVIQRSEER